MLSSTLRSVSAASIESTPSNPTTQRPSCSRLSRTVSVVIAPPRSAWTMAPTANR
jgi:hypothetical protein